MGSILWKFYAFSPMFFTGPVPKSRTSPNSSPISKYIVQLLPFLYKSLRDFIFGSFELAKVKLETLCRPQSPPRPGSSETRVVLFVGRKQLCIHSFHPLQNQNLQIYHPVLL